MVAGPLGREPVASETCLALVRGRAGEATARFARASGEQSAVRMTTFAHLVSEGPSCGKLSHHANAMGRF
jgi:hypothetical protein